MISSKKDLKEYLEADKIALGRKQRMPGIFDLIWRYEIALRKCEYYANTTHFKNPFKIIEGVCWKYIKFSLGTKCGFSIPNNTCGKGLSIAHRGTIIINPKASVGDFCRLHVGVNIGEDSRTGEARMLS